VGSWRLTVRHGSEVKRERFGSLEEAIIELERRAGSVRAEGGLDEVKTLRTFEPSERVAARLELTGPGVLRRPEAGVDVMGDGALVPYQGAIRKRRLEPRRGQSPFDAIHDALRGPG
jgi:hypothetical protein